MDRRIDLVQGQVDVRRRNLREQFLMAGVGLEFLLNQLSVGDVADDSANLPRRTVGLPGVDDLARLEE